MFLKAFFFLVNLTAKKPFYSREYIFRQQCESLETRRFLQAQVNPSFHPPKYQVRNYPNKLFIMLSFFVHLRWEAFSFQWSMIRPSIKKIHFHNHIKSLSDDGKTMRYFLIHFFQIGGSFSTAGSPVTMQTQCNTDTFTVSGSVGRSAICGTNSGYHSNFRFYLNNFSL